MSNYAELERIMLLSGSSDSSFSSIQYYAFLTTDFFTQFVVQTVTIQNAYFMHLSEEAFLLSEPKRI
jgi:hypothetical protein